MKATPVEATGCPVPAILIKAENDTDRLILKMVARIAPREQWVFVMHNECSEVDRGGVESILVGWRRREAIEPDAAAEKLARAVEAIVDAHGGTDRIVYPTPEQEALWAALREFRVVRPRGET